MLLSPTFVDSASAQRQKLVAGLALSSSCSSGSPLPHAVGNESVTRSDSYPQGDSYPHDGWMPLSDGSSLTGCSGISAQLDGLCSTASPGSSCATSSRPAQEWPSALLESPATALLSPSPSPCAELHLEQKLASFSSFDLLQLEAQMTREQTAPALYVPSLLSLIHI